MRPPNISRGGKRRVPNSSKSKPFRKSKHSKVSSCFKLIIDELKSSVSNEIKFVDNTIKMDNSDCFQYLRQHKLDNMDSDSGVLVCELVQSLSSHLNNIMNNKNDKLKSAKMHDLWTSFIVQDLERSVHNVLNDCEKFIVENPRSITCSSIKLGSIYAWARERSDEQNGEGTPTSEAKKDKISLWRKLSRLVYLSRAIKQCSHSHPILTNLRHELIKIRTRTTGTLSADKNVSSERALIIGKLQPILSVNESSSFDNLAIQSRFVTMFEKLANEITDLLVKLSHVIPGISVLKTGGDPERHKKNIHKQVVLAISGFYSQLNVNVEKEVQLSHQNNHRLLDDPIHEALVQTDSLASDEENSFILKSNIQLNPALIQASLDRFDHFNWSKQKRSTSNRVKDQSVGLLSSSSLMNKSNVESQVAKSPIDSVKIPESELTSNEKSVESHRTTGKVENICDNVVRKASQNSSGQTRERKFSAGRTRSKLSNKRKSNRSLRLRQSRTPSDHSCSEGEVLSDTEEERELSENDLAQSHVPNLDACEKTKPVQSDIEKDELLHLVNSQSQTTAPVSDVDITELEIMHEWAAPTSSVTVMEVDVSSEISIPEAPKNNESSLVDVNVTNTSHESDDIIKEILNESVESCWNDLHALVIESQKMSSPKSATIKISTDKNNTSNDTINLSDELEAMIERTTSAFKEHVTSVLANLLHALMVNRNVQIDHVVMS